MSLKNKLGGIAASFNAAETTQQDYSSRAKSAPVALTEFSMQFKEQEKVIKNLTESKGKPLELPLSEIHDSDYQIRPIDEAVVAALVANLQYSPLATPITVRRRNEGGYEIIAGHHRRRAFKDLGHETIPAYVVPWSDKETRRALLCDNLVRTELSDYRKYLSVKALLEEDGWERKELSEISSIPQSQISRLMSFEKIPENILEIVIRDDESYPRKTYPAYLIAAIASSKLKEEEVFEIFQKIREEEIENVAAIKMLGQKDSITSTEAPKAEFEPNHVEQFSRPDTLEGPGKNLDSGYIVQERQPAFIQSEKSPAVSKSSFSAEVQTGQDYSDPEDDYTVQRNNESEFNEEVEENHSNGDSDDDYTRSDENSDPEFDEEGNSKISDEVGNNFRNSQDRGQDDVIVQVVALAAAGDAQIKHRANSQIFSIKLPYPVEDSEKVNQFIEKASELISEIFRPNS